ncbi:Hypothetical protein FKW44_011594 [Caligus rogercresseyi]|uniref:Uncharacterized protein n=1 Tax=Caligus rogercresseyi TaxID=217165 RepID=A0A7T8KAE1_CALRO|nr:Hypothetical protein FKW44_011594 [Caligus rogercresseyi]
MVFGITNPPQWALGFRQTQSGCFGVTYPPPMGPWVPPNLIGVFWGYKSTDNGPSGSAEHNRDVLGSQIPRQWALGFRQTQSGCFVVKNPPPMGPQVPPNTIGVFGVTNPPPMGPRVPLNTIGVFWGYKSPAHGTSGSAKPNRGVLGLHIPRQWALGFHQT